MSDIHPGPLAEAPADSEHHQGPLAHGVPHARPRKTGRERRWERRRRRRYFEEVLGWVLVPVIAIALYWAVRGGLNALGTSPTALVQGIKAAIASRS